METVQHWLAQQSPGTSHQDTIRCGTIPPEILMGKSSVSTMPTISLAEADAPIPHADFVVRERIGDGGMGVVDAAEQRALQREVAVKRVRRKNDRRAHDTLIREARLVAQLDHPNILPVHLLANDETGAPVLVMKRIDGVTWKTLIEQPDHPYWADIKGERQSFHLRVIRQVAQALDYAHNRGILHRDIKIDNVMVGPYGEVYVLDWGVAVRLDEKGEAPSHPYGGTPNYSAPEMFNESGRLNAATDVYLLGATLHHVLVGQALHSGDSLEAVLIGALLAIPYNYPVSVPEELADICVRACSARREDRPPSARAFRDEIDNYLEHRHTISRIKAANQLLTKLGHAIQDTEQSAEEINRLGIQCRFAFEQLLEEEPESEGVRRGLTSALESIAWYELSQANVESARRLIGNLRSLGLSQGRLSALMRRLADVEREKREKMGELATQIQYRLLERLRTAEEELAKSVDLGPDQSGTNPDLATVTDETEDSSLNLSSDTTIVDPLADD